MIEKNREDAITKISYCVLMIWVLTPLLIYLMNSFNIDENTIDSIWIYITQLVGFLGLVFGTIDLVSHFSAFGKEIKIELNNKLSGMFGKPSATKGQLAIERKSSIDIIIALLPLLILLLFFLWVMVSFAFCDDKSTAFFGTLYRKEGILTYIAYGGFVLLGIQLSNHKILLKKLSNAFVLSGFVLSVESMITDMSQASDSYDKYSSVFFNSNHFGYYLLMVVFVNVLSFIFANNLYCRILYSLSYVTLINVIIINNTFGVYLALCISFAILLVFNLKYKHFSRRLLLILFLIFIGVSLGSLLYTDNIFVNFHSLLRDTSTLNDFIIGGSSEKVIESIGTGRGRLWSSGIDAIMKRPMFGYGLDSGSLVYNEYNIEMDRPHNMVIQMALFVGIPGAVLYYSTYVVGIKRLFKRINELPNHVVFCAFIIVGYTISSMFGNSMFYTSPYYLAILGICMSECLNGINRVDV